MLYKLLSKWVCFLGNPKSTLWDECFITRAKMNHLTILICCTVNSWFFLLIDIVKESNTIVIQRKSCKVFILCCSLEHFKETSWIILEILILSFSIIKVKIFTLKIAIPFNDFSLSLPQLWNEFIFSLNLFFQVSDSIFSPRIGDSKHWKFVIFFLQSFFEFMGITQAEWLSCSPVEIKVWLSYVIFLILERWCVEFVWFGWYLNNMVWVWTGIALLAFYILLLFYWFLLAC